MTSPGHHHATARAIRLAGWRLASTGSWKFARAGGVVTAVLFTLAVVFLASRGRGEDVFGVTVRAANFVAWWAGAVIALWCAGDRASADQNDGISQVALSHGIDERQLLVGRTAAAAIRLGALVFLSTLPVAVASIAASPSLTLAAYRAFALVPLAGFAVGVGLVAGALASGCGAMAPRRGRLLFLALFFLPWGLDDVVGRGHAQLGSLPGLLGFLSDLVAKLGGGL